MSKIKPYEMI